MRDFMFRGRRFSSFGKCFVSLLLVMVFILQSVPIFADSSDEQILGSGIQDFTVSTFLDTLDGKNYKDLVAALGKPDDDQVYGEAEVITYNKIRLESYEGKLEFVIYASDSTVNGFNVTWTYSQKDTSQGIWNTLVQKAGNISTQVKHTKTADNDQYEKNRNGILFQISCALSDYTTSFSFSYKASAVDGGKIYKVTGTNIVLVYTIADNQVTIVGMNEDGSGALVIPDTIEGYPVTTFAVEAFINGDKLTEITIPKTVTEIKDSVNAVANAFYSCIALKTIRVEDGNEKFKSRDGILYEIVDGKCYLKKCPIAYETSDVTVDETVSGIYYQAFEDCKNVKNIVIQAQIEELPQEVFCRSSIQSLTLPKTITKIYLDAFTKCSSLTDIYYHGSPDEWKKIWVETNQDELEKVTIHYSATGSTGFEIGRDNFKFANTASDFFSDWLFQYHFLLGNLKGKGININHLIIPAVATPVSNEDLQKLLSVATTNSEKEEIKDASKHQLWSGSCYGMATVMSILYADRTRLPLSKVSSLIKDDTETYQLRSPAQSGEIRSLVNYYQLTAYLAHFRNREADLCIQIAKDPNTAVQNLLKSVRNTKVPTVVSIRNNKDAHSILLLRVLENEETENAYVIECCDPCVTKDFTKLYLMKAQTNGEKGLKIECQSSATADASLDTYTELFQYDGDIDQIDYYNYFEKSQGYQEADKYYWMKTNKEINDIFAGAEDSIERGIVSNGRIISDRVYGPVYEEGTSSDHVLYLEKNLGKEYQVAMKNSSGEEGKLTVSMDNYRTDVSGTQNMKVSVNDAAGKVAVTSSVKGSLQTELTVNHVSSSVPWAHYSCSAKSSSVFSMAPSAVGMTLTGDALNGMVLNLENEIAIGKNTDAENQQEVTIYTDKDSVEIRKSAVNPKAADVYEDQNGDGVYEKKIGETKAVSKMPTFVRLAGQNRYDTAVKTVKEAFPNGSKSVVLVSGSKFPDALSASAYAGVKNMPILLTSAGGLSLQTKNLLQEWGVNQITIIGGTETVSTKVESSLRLQCGITNIHRIYGANRIETSLQVEKKGNFSTSACVVANSTKFADALSMSPWCYTKKMPIILANYTPTKAAYAVIRKYGTVYIAGGTNSVSKATENVLKGMGKNVIRLSGENRYSTSAKIAEYFTDRSGIKYYNNTVCASGRNFPDALTGAALAAANQAPIVLLNGKTTADDGFRFIKKNYTASDSGVINMYLLGDSNSISSDTEGELEKSWVS